MILELTANKISHRWSAAPVGDMLDVDPRSPLEHLAGKVTGRPGARGPVVELSGHALRELHQFSNIAYWLRRMDDDRHRSHRNKGNRREITFCIIG